MTLNLIPLTDAATEFTFCAYPAKGTAFIYDGQIYLDTSLASYMLCMRSFPHLMPFVEMHSDIYIVNGVHCLPDSFLFAMFILGHCKLFAGVAELLYEHSFQSALRAFMKPVS